MRKRKKNSTSCRIEILQDLRYRDRSVIIPLLCLLARYGPTLVIWGHCIRLVVSGMLPRCETPRCPVHHIVLPLPTLSVGWLHKIKIYHIDLVRILYRELILVNLQSGKILHSIDLPGKVLVNVMLGLRELSIKPLPLLFLTGSFFVLDLISGALNHFCEVLDQLLVIR